MWPYAYAFRFSIFVFSVQNISNPDKKTHAHQTSANTPLEKLQAKISSKSINFSPRCVTGFHIPLCVCVNTWLLVNDCQREETCDCFISGSWCWLRPGAHLSTYICFHNDTEEMEIISPEYNYIKTLSVSVFITKPAYNQRSPWAKDVSNSLCYLLLKKPIFDVLWFRYIWSTPVTQWTHQSAGSCLHLPLTSVLDDPITSVKLRPGITMSNMSLCDWIWVREGLNLGRKSKVVLLLTPHIANEVWNND